MTRCVQSEFFIKAETDECAAAPVKSVRFEIGDSVRCENRPPYMAGGDQIRPDGSVNYAASEFSPTDGPEEFGTNIGVTSLSVTPFSEPNCQGVPGEQFTNDLRIKDCRFAFEVYNADTGESLGPLAIFRPSFCRSDDKVTIVIAWNNNSRRTRRNSLGNTIPYPFQHRPVCGSYFDITVEGPNGFQSSRREWVAPFTAFGDAAKEEISGIDEYRDNKYGVAYGEASGHFEGRFLEPGVYTITAIPDEMPEYGMSQTFEIESRTEGSPCCWDNECNKVDTGKTGYPCRPPNTCYCGRDFECFES